MKPSYPIVLIRTVTVLALSLTLAACSTAPYRPEPLDVPSLEERSSSQQRGLLEVSAFTPGAEEAAKIFGAPLYKRGIQPVWLKIENNTGLAVRMAHYSVDPDYFTPLEVAYMQRRRFSRQGHRDMEAYLHSLSIPRRIAHGETASGFVFTNLSQGTKAFNVDIFYTEGQPDHDRFTFFLQVPDFRPDHADVDFKSLYEASAIQNVDTDGLRQALKDLPCCSTDQTGSGDGKPINIVLVAKGSTLLQALLRAGWSETTYEKDATYLSAADYLFGRPPDAIFRKNRGKTTERSELNLWLAPLRWENDHGVWMAQFKHAIGRRFEIEEVFLGTRMDPDVDDGRNYLLQDLWYAQSLKWLAQSRTGKEIPPESPAFNFRDNPYFSDGYRFVMWLSDEPVALNDAQLLVWDEAPRPEAEP